MAAPVEGPGAPRPRWLCAAVTVADGLVAALPWLTAAILGLSSADHIWARVPDVAAFTARAEPGLATLGSLASLGGIWNSEAVPASRTTLFAVVSAVVLLAVVATGLIAVARHRAAAPLVVLALASVLLSAALATGPGIALLHNVVDAAPGMGVLRDGQKWVALAMPGYALAGAGAVLTLRRWLRFFRANGPCGGVLRRTGAVPSRHGLGCRRETRTGALPERLDDRRGDHQQRARRSRGVTGRHHASLRLVWVRSRYWIRCRVGYALMF